MNFTSEFIEEIQRNRTYLLSLLEVDNPSKLELKLKKELLNHWHSLPIADSSIFREFSIDSSSAMRSLSRGIDFFIVRALMLGSNGFIKKKMMFDAIPGITDSDVSSKLLRILRDLIEIKIIVENCPNSEGNLVLIDGNLYSRYTHPMEQLNIKGREHLPLQLFEAMQKMFEICREKGIVVVGVSKSSKTRALGNAFLDKLEYSREALDIPDFEMLYRWKREEKGFTTPLILGNYAFREDPRAMWEEPEKYLNRYFRDIPENLREWGIEVIRKVPLAPAIIMFHLIPEIGEQPLRIDVPVNCLGMKDRILDVLSFRFADSYIIEDLISQLIADRGGREVYNALLYVVDKEVRLSSNVVDKVYKSILGSELKIPIEYDRSTRRFY